MIYDSLEALRLRNPSVTHDSILLMIYVSLWAVWAVEVNYHPRQQFVDDLRVPRACLASRLHASLPQQFVYDI